MLVRGSSADLAQGLLVTEAVVGVTYLDAAVEWAKELGLVCF